MGTSFSCKSADQWTRRGRGSEAFSHSQVQGVWDPLHLQVKNVLKPFPLQVSGSVESQVQGVPNPLPLPVNTLLLIKLKELFLPLCV